MGFNEKTHAFIAAKYYMRLTERFGDRGKKAFIHATQYYAEQRGRRMAQRAIRDGRELDYGAYCEYGEWVHTEETLSDPLGSVSEVLSVSPDYVIKITACPWHTQFKEMELTEAGATYCAHLDNSICRGFNPYLTYEVSETLHKGDHCLQTIRDVYFKEGEQHPKKEQYVKGFDYHCGHLYWSYGEVSEAIFGAEGKAVAEAVMKDLEGTYGRGMAEKLASYKDTDFNVCGD